MNKKLNIGIIGTGFGQHVLLPAFRSIENVEILAIAATALQRAEKAAQNHNIPRAYGSWEEIVNDSDIEALAIAVPPPIQQEIIPVALNQGKHLFCEKPLGITPFFTKKMVEAAAKRNLANMVDFQFCAIPAWQAAHSFIKSQGLGSLNTGVLNWHVETYANQMGLINWKTQSNQGGGVLLNFLSHVLFNLEWLCGPIAEVLIHCIPSFLHDKTAQGLIKFENGLIFSISVGSASYAGSGHRLELYGDQGSLQLINTTSDYINGFEFIAHTKNSTLNTATDKIVPLQPIGKDGRTAAVACLVNRFIRWIQTGEAQQPSFQEGHRVNLLIAACQLSHQQQRWIALEKNSLTTLPTEVCSL